ncbi:MAG: alpha/beta hydrolase, partial [Nitrospirae bacterium]|nr:alpha/beta hydrolase [Nitrospirota bacterium]
MINKTLEKEVKIKLADVSLEGSLGLPSGAEGVVLFSH